jgi:hypothetical protein
MANYIITSCDGVTSYVVEAGETTINTGSTYYFTFTGDSTPMCYNVTGESIDPFIDRINSAVEYTDCLTCLQDNQFSFLVSGCTIPTGGPVNSIEFSEFALGQFYKLCANDPLIFEGCFCFEVVGILPGFYPYTFNPQGPFTDCDCPEPPRSAGTEYNVCEVCFDGSVVTVYNIQPPHPVYTDGYGTPVTQLNMVVLGGPNGLNS